MIVAVIYRHPRQLSECLEMSRDSLLKLNPSGRSLTTFLVRVQSVSISESVTGKEPEY